jgi:hypothetical protein
MVTTPRRLALGVLVLGAVGAVACNALLGVEDLKDRGGDVDGDGSSGNDGAASGDGGDGSSLDGSGGDDGGPSGEGGPATWCDGVRASDPTVVFCADFDRGSGDAAVARGWDSVVAAGGGRVALEPAGDAGSPPNAVACQAALGASGILEAALEKGVDGGALTGFELSFDARLSPNPTKGWPQTESLSIVGLVGGRNVREATGLVYVPFGTNEAPAFFATLNGTSPPTGLTPVTAWPVGQWVRAFITLTDDDASNTGTMSLRLGSPASNPIATSPTSKPVSWQAPITLFFGPLRADDAGAPASSAILYEFDDVVMRVR